MSINRYGKRRDKNEPEIILALKRVGCSVMSIDQVDLVVGYKGVNYLMEIKNPESDKKPKTSKRSIDAYIKPHQQKFIEEWKGQVSIIETLEDALELIGVTY